MVDEEPPKGPVPSALDSPDWRTFLLSAPTSAIDDALVRAGEQPPKVDTPPSGSDADVIKDQVVADMEANRLLREKYAEKAHWLASACLWGWGLMLLATGVVNGVRGQDLWSDKVIIAVTTGVTVSVLAAFLGVIRGLFPNGQSKESQKSGK
jgi:hypothetical protein